MQFRGQLTCRIETERLILRPPEECDLEGWASLWADPVATRYVGGLQSRGQAWRNMATEAGSWRLKGYGMFSVIEKATGLWVGRVGPHWPEGYPQIEVGWGLLTAHWGRGIATEAAIAAVDAVFRETDVPQIIHLIDPDNVRSIRLAQRLGATRGGREKLCDPYDRFTVDRWCLPKSVWTAAKLRAKASIHNLSADGCPLTMVETIVRPYATGDREGVIALIVPIQQQEFGFSITADDQPDLASIPSFYQSAKGGFWVAERAGAIVGTIGLKDIGMGQGALRKMFVAASARGAQHGVAARLLAALIAHARINGMTEIFLGTTTAFLAAHRFYEKNGFVELPRASLPADFPIMTVDRKFYRLAIA